MSDPPGDPGSGRGWPRQLLAMVGNTVTATLKAGNRLRVFKVK